MQVFREKPAVAWALLVLALLVLGASLYFTFGRRAASPFEDAPVSSPQPTQPVEPPSQDREATTIL